MSFRRISINIICICYCLRESIVSGSNPKAYLYYENAQCTDDSNIEGTYVIAFDDENFADYGYSDYYSGPCVYLTGGYWEVDMSYYTNAYESIEQGNCVECNGLVGCSSDGTCDSFMSTVPQASYQMAQDDDDDSETEIADGAYAMAAQIQQSTIKTLESERTYSSSAKYVMLGAFIGCAALFSLLATLEGLRFLRQSKRSRVDVNSLPLTADEAKHDVVV